MPAECEGQDKEEKCQHTDCEQGLPQHNDGAKVELRSDQAGQCLSHPSWILERRNHLKEVGTVVGRGRHIQARRFQVGCPTLDDLARQTRCSGDWVEALKASFCQYSVLARDVLLSKRLLGNEQRAEAICHEESHVLLRTSDSFSQ